jgi:hypothetical protein
VLSELDLSKHVLHGALDFALPDSVVGTFRADTAARLARALVWEEDKDREAVVALFDGFLESFKGFGVDRVRDAVACSAAVAALCPLKRLEYSVKPPRPPLPAVVVSAELVLANPTQTVTVGDVIKCRLSVKPVSWTSRESSLKLQYQVTVDASHWMLGGYRILEFDLQQDQAESLHEVILIPLQPGRMLLPAVHVSCETAALRTVECIYPWWPQITVFPKPLGKLFVPLVSSHQTTCL